MNSSPPPTDENEGKPATIYLMQARKQDHPDSPFTGWREIAFERFDYVECSIAQKKTSDFTERDQVIFDRYGTRPDGWIEPHNSPVSLPPASETATPETRWREAFAITAQNKENAYALVNLDDLRAALAYVEEIEGNYGSEMARADNAEFALAAATRELEEAQANISAYHAQFRNENKTLICDPNDAALHIVNLQRENRLICSDLLLARQQGEEMRGALLDMITFSTQEGWNTPLYLPEFGAALRRARDAAALATPSPQGNNGETK